MGFKRVNAREESKKIIGNDKELIQYKEELDIYYELIDNAIRYRKKLGLSQEDVAKKSGLSQQAVSRLEKGINSPSLATLLKYLGAMGLKLALANNYDEIGCTKIHKEVAATYN